MEGEMIVKKQVKDILTSDELIQVYEHRISLLKSESAMERNYYNYENEKFFDKAEKQYNAELKNPVRVRDVMTNKELQEFEELNLAFLTSVTKSQREYYNYEIEQIIEKAKSRYRVSVGSSYDYWLEDDDLYDDLVDEVK